MAYALDPDNGERCGGPASARAAGSAGWGASATRRLYFGVADGQTQNPGGMRAVNLATGEQIWSASRSTRLCASTPRCSASQGGATT